MGSGVIRVMGMLREELSTRQQCNANTGRRSDAPSATFPAYVSRAEWLGLRIVEESSAHRHSLPVLSEVDDNQPILSVSPAEPIAIDNWGEVVGERVFKVV